MADEKGDHPRSWKFLDNENVFEGEGEAQNSCGAVPYVSGYESAKGLSDLLDDLKHAEAKKKALCKENGELRAQLYEAEEEKFSLSTKYNQLLTEEKSIKQILNGLKDNIIEKEEINRKLKDVEQNNVDLMRKVKYVTKSKEKLEKSVAEMEKEIGDYATREAELLKSLDMKTLEMDLLQENFATEIKSFQANFELEIAKMKKLMEENKLCMCCENYEYQLEKKRKQTAEEISYSEIQNERFPGDLRDSQGVGITSSNLSALENHSLLQTKHTAPKNTNLSLMYFSDESPFLNRNFDSTEPSEMKERARAVNWPSVDTEYSQIAGKIHPSPDKGSEKSLLEEFLEAKQSVEMQNILNSNVTARTSCINATENHLLRLKEPEKIIQSANWSNYDLDIPVKANINVSSLHTLKNPTTGTQHGQETGSHRDALSDLKCTWPSAVDAPVFLLTAREHIDPASDVSPISVLPSNSSVDGQLNFPKPVPSTAWAKIKNYKMALALGLFGLSIMFCLRRFLLNYENYAENSFISFVLDYSELTHHRPPII